MFDLRMETSDSVGYIITVGKPIVDAQLFTTAKEFHIILHKRVYTYIHYTYRADRPLFAINHVAPLPGPQENTPTRTTPAPP